MYKNFCIIIISAFTLLSCGYSSLYNQDNYFDFTISKLEIKGDREINNLIEKRLEKYSNNQSLNKFEEGVSLYNIFKELKKTTSKVTYAYYAVYSEYGRFLCYSEIANQYGSVFKEHSF